MFRNHEGGREANFQHGENYKHQIKEYWGARGYDLIADSAMDNITPDLIFRKTHEHGSEDIYVEAKYTKLSRTDSNFLTEFARYFIDFQTGDGFSLHLFIRGLSAHQKWRKIFDPNLSDPEMRESFWERVKEDSDLQPEEEEKLKTYGKDDFLSFIDRTCLHKAGYDTLRMETDKLRDDSEFETDRFVTQQEPYNERSELEPNFGEISKYPATLHVGNVAPSQFTPSITHSFPTHLPIWFERNKVFTLLPPSNLPSPVETILDEDSMSEKDFESWAKEEENELAGRILLLKKVCNQAVTRKFDCSFEDDEKRRKLETDTYCEHLKYRGDHFLLFQHPRRAYEIQKVEEQQTSKVYDDFVRHRAAKLNIHIFGDTHYLSILVKDHFTQDGSPRTLIRGSRKGKLHDSFNQNNYTNSQAYSEYRHWRNILRVDRKHRQLSSQEIGYSQVTGISIPKRPPEDFEEAEEQGDSDTKQGRLGQFES